MIKLDKWLIGIILFGIVAVYVGGKIKRRADKGYEIIESVPMKLSTDSVLEKQPVPIIEYQSTTYLNNFGADLLFDEAGSLHDWSHTWTITQDNGLFNFTTNAMSNSFDVVFSHYSNDERLYYYNVNGSVTFDGNKVVKVLSKGTLGEYSAGDLSGGNSLYILFDNRGGYFYRLGK